MENDIWKMCWFLRSPPLTSRTQDFYVALPSHPAAVNDHNMTVQVIARRGREKDGCTDEVFRFAPATSRNTLKYLTVASLICLQRSGVVSAHVTRSDGVDIDSAFG